MKKTEDKRLDRAELALAGFSGIPDRCVHMYVRVLVRGESEADRRLKVKATLLRWTCQLELDNWITQNDLHIYCGIPTINHIL